ncbi:MAG TPA: hypothetical protein VGN80_14055 [Devosiaceae bacterium]|jgi:hypothetical protein|nr:hypothetical protein [Devosiaceae bacterium]
MTRRYQLARPDAFPRDAVVVTVREVHGQPVGEVACAHCPKAEGYEVADFPRPIAIALERAEELRAICELARVMIALAPGARWKPEWGELVETPPVAGRPRGTGTDRVSERSSGL